ncbi:MAG TPA: SDR family NAD(P)-dependent oxidoreductase [Fimbriiglobus sp.]|jgi:short-subunit dehydrogenase
MRRELKDKVVLLTGASRGIGRRIADRLVAKGAKVGLVARSTDVLSQTASELKSAGGDVLALPADLTKPADRDRVVAETIGRFGGLDVLINGAGVAAYGPFATGTEDVLRTIMEINFFAVAEMIRLCQPHLLKSATTGRRPAILNLTSVVGRVGTPGVSEHSASKFALVGLTEALRGEFARYDIDVLMVHPGLVQSDDLDRHLLRDEPMLALNFRRATPPEAVANRIVSALESGKREATVGRTAWWACFGKRMAPRMVRIVMRRRVRRFARSMGK